MNSISSRQLDIDLLSDRNGYRFEHEGQHHVLPSMDRVHAFFQKQPFDTVKLSHEGKKTYVHFNLDDVEVFDSKKALRKTISQESDGAWVEEKEGKKRYFVDDSGWFQTSFKQVSKDEFFQRVESPSTLQKVLGIGLGILALLPGALEIKERLPFGASGVGMGLLALQRKSPLLGALGCSFLPSTIHAQPIGTEFQVNNYTIKYQTHPSIANLNDGGFVVTWGNSPQDGVNSNVSAQRYSSDGALVGLEFQVNTYTTSYQWIPKIAPLSDGGFVICWQSSGQDGDGSGIYGQRYSSSGAPFGPEFQVNNYTTSDQEYVAIAPTNNGGFVLSWTSNGQDGDLDGIFAQKYDSNGASMSSEFRVNNDTASNQQDSAIASLNDGGFVVVWRSCCQDGDSGGIFAQRYDSNRAPFGPEFQVNNYTLGNQRFPAIETLSNNGLIIAWQSPDQDGDGLGIFAQKYDNNGTPTGPEFQVNNYTTNDQSGPSIGALNDGGFVIAWTSINQDGDSLGVFAQRYSSSGALFGPEFQVNNYTTSYQRDPVIARMNDGGYIIVWNSGVQNGASSNIFGQRYDRDGNPVPLTYLPSMSSSPTLGSKTGTTNVPSSQLGSSGLSVTSSTTLPSSTDPNSSPSSTNGVESSSEISNIASSILSGFQIPNLIDVVYGDSYSITQNGQTIGTFTISGGTGLYSGSNPNTLNIEIDPDTFLQDGDTAALFSVPEGEELQWEGVTFLNSDGCFNAEGELVRNEENNGNKYQVIFSYEGESCSIYGDASKLGAIPVLTSGGLI